MKATVIQIKNGIMMNVRVSEKDSMTGVLLKMIICGILVYVIVNVIRHV